MWWSVCKGLDSLPTPSRRCRMVLVALSIGFLTWVFYRGAAREAQVPGLKKVVNQENNGESRNDAASAAGFQNIAAFDSDTFVEGKFKGGANRYDKVSENYATKSEENLDLKIGVNKLKLDLGSVSTSTNKTAHPSTTITTTTTTSSSLHLPPTTTTSPTQPKTILFYTKISLKWAERLKENTASLMDKCPISNCVFLDNSTTPEEADAVIFHVQYFDPESVPSRRRPDQLYVWLSLEAPTNTGFGLPQPERSYKSLDKFPQQEAGKKIGRPGFFNWTCTYHRDSDVMHPYGGLVPLEGEDDYSYVRPGLLNKSVHAYTEFMAALDRGDTLEDKAFLSRPKLVAWMVSHCKTSSGRELYVEELRQHIQVDIYGACGELKCDEKLRRWCYEEVLMPTYKFYLAFENSLCEDYVTEKMWNPMHDGMVPVVYGGAQYSDILPPHSYVDATNLTPLQLADLLYSIVSSPQLYGRYHLWRKYWKVVLTPPLCELCVKLHSQTQGGSEGALRHQSYHNLSDWWWSRGKCTTQYPSGSPQMAKERGVLHWCLFSLFLLWYR